MDSLFHIKIGLKVLLTNFKTILPKTCTIRVRETLKISKIKVKLVKHAKNTPITKNLPKRFLNNVAGDKCYFIPNGTKQFIQADINCKQQNGDLASIANAFDNNALRGKNCGCIS